MPIVRRTRLFNNACGDAWLYWLWSCGPGTQTVCTLWKSFFHKVHTACIPAPHVHSQHNQALPRALLNNLVLLTMGTMMPETCWESTNQENKHQIVVTSSWFYYLPGYTIFGRWVALETERRGGDGRDIFWGHLSHFFWEIWCSDRCWESITLLCV